MKGNKNSLKFYLKNFVFEIIAFVLFSVLFIRLQSTDFARRLIISSTYFRPEYTYTLFIIFIILTAVLALLLFMQVRKKKLKSTTRLSPFAKTVVRSNKVREMSQTQVVYTAQTEIIAVKSTLPKDIDITNPNVIELYFNYEENLNI